MVCPNCGKKLGFCPLCGAGVNDISTNSGSGKIMVCSNCRTKLNFCPVCGINVSNSFEDPRDKKVYKTVTIGKQVWMAENLAFNAKGSKCYDNDPANCQKYGRLYDWETAKKVCPTGWHLPDDDEWLELVKSVGGEAIAGKKLKAKEGWNGTSGNGTDDYNFAALPGGLCDYSDGYFGGVGNRGLWWSTDPCGGSIYNVYYIGMDNCNDNVSKECSDKKILLSVRCVQD